LFHVLRGYFLSIRETLILLTPRLSSSPPGEFYRLPAGDLEEFVDSFDRVDRLGVYEIPDRD